MMDTSSDEKVAVEKESSSQPMMHYGGSQRTVDGVGKGKKATAMSQSSSSSSFLVPIHSKQTKQPQTATSPADSEAPDTTACSLTCKPYQPQQKPQQTAATPSTGTASATAAATVVVAPATTSTTPEHIPACFRRTSDSTGTSNK